MDHPGFVKPVDGFGDSYDNALAETINGPYKAEVIWRQRSWPSASAVKMATLRWVDWFNSHRLFGPIGSRMPFVRAYFRETQELVFDAHDKAFLFYGGVCSPRRALGAMSR